MAKKINITPEQLANRWANGIQNSSQKIKDGVNAVTEAPGKAAAAQVELWMSNLQNSKAKWQKNVASVSVEDWRKATIEKGIPALQNSVNMAKPKVQKNAEKLISTINSLMSTLPPKGTTIEANLERVRHMAVGLNKAFAV